MQTLVERLRVDFGKKTLGELIQDREAAALEIERLTFELARIGMDGRELLRLKDVCNIVGLSRSTIYSAIARQFSECRPRWSTGGTMEVRRRVGVADR